ncbi:glycosyltransferase family 8 protein [Clostridium tertium]|jgi:lipopolysaccharide biosynthesis glycosyltransferase|uniref:glycosyltransferase family 8 protein n=2 Tax=Clostridium tertium TaxID=1559 RepID=UPI0018AA2D65|nr:glycosyltransferase family 8 protein [Clostridium tertium]MBU6136966.1 glycosyltransferase family 8 protein [Clostridium tertium]
MSSNRIDLLVTFDKNYIPPFQTMLKSLVLNNPRETFHIWLLHSEIPLEMLQEVEEYCAKQGAAMTSINVERSVFKNAPVSKRYPQEMYYRLLAPLILPKSIKKILYLDPDILIINSIRPLWETELGNYIFAAASHVGVTGVINDINRARLRVDHDYYNSGVMLMDLTKARSIVNVEEIFQCVREHKEELLLPDQDIFNYLYGKQTLPLDDAIWNYDARKYSNYLLRSGGNYDMDWITRNTVVLHFCGKSKPWKHSQNNRFAMLYKHYMQISIR